jgi:hypothetical protein
VDAGKNPGAAPPRRGWSVPVDRAIFFAVGARLWQFLAGVVSLWIIARHFSKDVQGYYYLFVNLLGVQTFFDLGLTGVLTYVAAHEWSDASHDDAAGAVARQRLGELLVRSRRWYAWCAAGFTVLALVLGWWYFRGFGQTAIHWEWPWVAAVVVSAFSLWLSPSIVILEGCNYVAQVNALRLVQAVTGNLVVWTVILAGGDLWAVAASAAVRLAAEAFLVGVAYRPFLQRLTVAAQSGPSAFSWSAELLPLQWKIGVQAVAAYFLWTAYTPIISHYYGLELGGRMGMTLQAISTIQMVALAWIQTRVPRIGSLLARGNDRDARGIFRGMLAACLGVYVLASAAFLVLILLLHAWKPALAERVLDPVDVVLFEIGMGLTLLISGLATYVRAHKIDPFLWVGLLNAAVTGTLVWYFGRADGPRGAALAHIGVTVAIMLPATIVIYRNVSRRAATHDPLPQTHSPHSAADTRPD